MSGMNTTIITEETLGKLDEALKKILPKSLSNYTYIVLDGTDMLIKFIPDIHPSEKELDFLGSEVLQLIDSIIPMGDEVPSWLATVEVGAKAENGLAIGGTRVYGFEGSTKKFGPGVITP